MSISDVIGEEIYEACRKFFAWCFPGSSGINNEMMDGLVRALYRNHGKEAVQHGWPEMPPELLAPTKDEIDHKKAIDGAPTYPLYRAQATHHRVRSMTNPALHQQSDVPFGSEFGEILPVVRVPLPNDFFDAPGPVRQTKIGVVDLKNDHILGSLEAIKNHDFGTKLPFVPGHVELITPARTGPLNWRFGAIAAYLCYRHKDDPTPSFYILEAGMATGEAKEVYLGQSMDEPIKHHRSGYHPTAYSGPDNTYSGQIQVLGNEPTRLWIQATPPGKQDYYIQVTVLYTVTPIVENDPLLLLLHAAMRIALVGEKMKVPSGVPVPGALALLAHTLHWMIDPAYGSSGSTASH
jgi:hypothetical protein